MTSWIIIILSGVGLLAVGYLFFSGIRLLVKKRNIGRYAIVRNFNRAFLGACILISIYNCWIWTEETIHAKDIKIIDISYSQFHLAMHSKQYETAYNYMAPAYQKQKSIDEFREDFSFAGETWLYLDTDRAINISGNHATLYPGDTNDSPWSGPIYKLIKVDSNWYFTGEYDWSLD
jgi:hypothetical protein